MVGYINFSDPTHAITDYIVGYYSALKPHEYNDGLPPNEAEKRYWKNSKGVDFTCSTYTNNVELTFDDANSALNGRDTLVTHSVADGKALTGLAVGLYNSEGKTVRTGVKQSLGIAQKGKNTAYFQAAIVQTAAQITDSKSNSFTGEFTAKTNLTLTYY